MTPDDFRVGDRIRLHAPASRRRPSVREVIRLNEDGTLTTAAMDGCGRESRIAAHRVKHYRLVGRPER